MPKVLIFLDCRNNKIKKFKYIPDTLFELYCDNNELLVTDLDIIKKIYRFIIFFSKNIILKNVFLYFIKRRCAKYKEELIIKACHPSRLINI